MRLCRIVCVCVMLCVCACVVTAVCAGVCVFMCVLEVGGDGRGGRVDGVGLGVVGASITFFAG